MPVAGWLGWLEFGVSVNPIPTRGADYAHRITACPPGFENLTASLFVMSICLVKKIIKIWNSRFGILVETCGGHYGSYGNTGCGVFKRGGTKLERFLH